MRPIAIRNDQHPEEWPPPPHAVLAGVSFILAINAFAWRAWMLLVLFLLLAAVAAAWRRVTH